jgi:hypothetical protein
MNSRELAVELRNVANFLDTRPEFELPSYYKAKQYITFWDKQEFIEAAKSLGDATKDYTDYDFQLTSKHAPVVFSIARDKVCKKTVTFDCEPLFSIAEVEAF